MAIVQISRITQRQGLTENLPQLAGAEFGWAVDSRRLFIGNGTLADGAPTVGNTEVLTEYSDILALAKSYTYKGDAAGYTVQTGPSASDPITRTLQAVLDDYACVKDFGAAGDGTTDDTAAINRALQQLYCVPDETQPQVRRSLFFPAGVYRVTSTLLIPPFARLIGEGANSSIIQFNALNYNISFSYLDADLVVDGTDYYRAMQNVPAGVPLSDIEYWAPVSLTGGYVATTSDSLQQTGVNIGNNAAITPQLVEINDIAFTTTEPIISILSIEDASQITVRSCNFYGPYTTTSLATPTDDAVCVGFFSTPSLISNHITFDGCRFSSMVYAVNADEQVQGVVFSNSKFDTLYQGILLGTGTPVNGGPTGVRIIQNLFDQISYEGIIFGDVANNVSGYNIFLDVANEFQGAGYPAASVIDIQANNNVSVGDMFERNDNDNSVHLRINLNNKQAFALDNGERYKFGSYNREAGGYIFLEVAATDTPIFTVPVATVNGAFIMEYRYQSSITSLIRYGRLTVVGEDGAGALAYNDDYVENGATGLTLIPSMSGTNIVMSYTAPTDQGYLSYSLSHF